MILGFFMIWGVIALMLAFLGGLCYTAAWITEWKNGWKKRLALFIWASFVISILALGCSQQPGTF